MNFEQPSIESFPEILWTETAKRFKDTIETQRALYIKKFGESNIDILEQFNLVEGTVEDIFPAYEKKNLSIQAVERDLRYRMEQTSDEKQKSAYQQVLFLIDGRGLQKDLLI